MLKTKRNKISIDAKAGCVEKWHSLVENYTSEVSCLRKLEDFDRCPNLLKTDDDQLYVRMTYVGEPLTKENMPDDWRHQCNHILDELGKRKFKHGDFHENIMVLNGKLYLIDFGDVFKQNHEEYKLDEFLLFAVMVCVRHEITFSDVMTLITR